MADRIENLLERIYGAEAAEMLAPNLKQRIEARRSQLPQRDNTALFTEQDAVLITYGDTIREPNETPLRTLARFAADYLKGVISAVHILPFFPYSSDDGFSVMDFYAVDPELGTWDDIQALSEDFDLMFDAVFNHASAQGAWFQSFLAGEPGYENLFFVESPETDLSMVTRPRATPLLTVFNRPDGEAISVWTTFSADQVDFDFRSPQTLLRLLDVLLFYVEKGATIIRLDAIAYIWKKPGTPSIHLEQAHAIIQLMRAVLDEAAPHVVIITETNVPHQENVSYFGDGTNEAQMVYNFTLPPLVFHTLRSGDATKLRGWVNTLDTPSNRTTFFNFTASHDGVGVRPVEGILTDDELNLLVQHVESRGGRVSYKTNPDGSQSPYELNISYVDAITNAEHDEATQVQQFIVSQAIAMSLAGVPAVYIHSLVGSRSDIAGMQRTGRNRTINRAKLLDSELRAALNDPQTFRARIFERYTHLLKLRREQPAFHPNAAQQAVETGNPAVFALLRTAQQQHIMAVYNVSAAQQSADLGMHLPAAVTDLMTSAQISPQMTLEPYQMYWLAW